MSKMKKQTKINDQIKRIFNGSGFDEGITRLDEDALLELAMLLELKVENANPHELIKTLRRVWSEGDMLDRRTILNYLQGLNQHFDEVLHETHEDKAQKIEQIVTSLKLDEEDKKRVIEHFTPLRLKKININKITRFLERYQQYSKKERLEKEAEGTFLDDGFFEFFHTFEFSLHEHNLKKIFVLQTKALARIDFLQHAYEELLDQLQKAKAVEISHFSALLNNLLEQLKMPNHPYLTMEERLNWVKALEPHSDLEAFSLPFELLHTTIRKELTLHNVIITKSAVHAMKKASYPLTETISLPYVYELTLPLWKISAQIIKGESLDIEEQLEALKTSQIDHFKLNYDVLLSEIQSECESLELPTQSAKEYLALQLKEFFASDRSLHISHKIHQKILHNFMLYTADLRWQKQKEALLARTIRDFKALFPLARTLNRKIIFHAGPTNSGKTYDAMQALKDADTGVYLAPLRLLALEGYETLNGYNVPTTLLTGEEELFNEDAGHVSSTIEMADFETQIDVAVIDEIQMISDRDRGWAWSNALIGIPAKTIYLTGSLNAIDAIKELAQWLGEDLEIIYHERKNRQEVLAMPIALTRIEKASAVIAFTRSDVLRLRQKLSAHYKVSVIYGNLSPEVRREEARRFREGESDVLVATDAIAMGLNLPIKTLLFSKETKFDGEVRRLLTASEVQQIAGRAGRYGIEEIGYIGAIDSTILRHIQALLHKPLEQLRPPFNVMANFQHIQLVSSILQSEKLQDILNFFAKHMQFDGPFKAAHFESMQLLSAIVDRYALSLKERFTFATAPVGSALSIVAAFERYLEFYTKNETVPYLSLDDLPDFADTQERLRDVEDKIKEISLYLWLAYRFEKRFTDAEKALKNRSELNHFVERSLQKGSFIKRCTQCGKALPMEYEFAICQSCFIAHKREKRGQHRTYTNYKKR